MRVHRKSLLLTAVLLLGFCVISRTKAIAQDSRSQINKYARPASAMQSAEDQTPVNFMIAFIGDRSTNSNAAAVLNLIKSEGASAVLHAGDLGYSHGPQAFEDQTNAILGLDFPYFVSLGNHDDSYYYIPGGYKELLEARMNRLGISWDGELTIKSSFKYKGIFFVLTGPDIFDVEHDIYIRDKLAQDNSIWRVSSWHKNMNLMQVYSKSDETGWPVYEESRKGGAIIATGHAHTYSRSHLLSDIDNPVIDNTSNTLVLSRDAADTPEDEGKTFVFVSGLGGRDIKPQLRTGNWWASIYTSTQAATYGVLFGVFNYNGDPNLAKFYFKNINGTIIDEFYVKSYANAEFTLTTNVAGSGTISLNPPGGSYAGGAEVTLTAVPSPGFVFNGWSGDVSSAANPATLVMDADKTVTATFTSVPPGQFTLMANVVGSGSVGFDPPGGVYDVDTEVTVTATPASGYQFDGWSGDLSGLTNPATIIVDDNKTVTANFSLVQYTLDVSTVGPGSVTLNPPGGAYSSGTIVTLTANPSSGFQFSGWSGALSGLTNPATITMDGDKSVAATFSIIQYALTVNINGSGNVTLNPPGGTYDAGTVVTLTASADVDFQFAGWTGALSGSSNPATLTMDSPKSVTAVFTPIGGGEVTHEETKTGGASNLTQVTISGNLSAVAGHLYLAAISTYPKVAVNSISGLGLNWTLVKSQCSGQNSTGIEVWMAQGTPSGNGTVSATLAASTKAVIAVSRYSGVAAINPVGTLISGNTKGLNGACTGGSTSKTYSFNLTTTSTGAVVYGAAAMRNKKHTPGSGYTERAEILQASAVSVAIQDKKFALPATVALNGALSNTVDWAVVGLEIKPQSGGGSPQYSLTVNTTGSGSVALNPTGGTYASGTQVTLTANPSASWSFSGWSGNLSGSTNPATITMNSNKNVTAAFTEIGGGGGQITHEETKTGGASSSMTVATSAALTGASGNLYLAAISTKPYVAVNSISGLGLSWTLVKKQCAGRNQTGVEVWQAQGTPSGNGIVTATLAASTTAVISVSRYSGVATTGAIGNLISGNTNGLSGACSGGVDNNSYSFNLTTTAIDAVIYGAASMRSKTHSPGAGYTERAEFIQASAASVAIEDKPAPSPGSAVLNGSFSSSVDWAIVGVEIKPHSGSSPIAVEKEVSDLTNTLEPLSFEVRQNFPNPFNPETTIRFTLPSPNHVRIQIYNVLGQLVRTLINAPMEPGRREIMWDGRDENNLPAPSGVYLYRLIAGEHTATRSLLLMR